MMPHSHTGKKHALGMTLEAPEVILETSEGGLKRRKSIKKYVNKIIDPQHHNFVEKS